MSVIVSIGGGEVAAPEPASPPVAVEGWASSDYTSSAPPVIVNTAADASAMVAWAMGQVAQLNELLTIISCARAGQEVKASDLAGAVHHFTAQVQHVLQAAHERMESDTENDDARESGPRA